MLLLGLLFLAVAYAQNCQPIYPGCTCQTVSLSCADFNTIYANISDSLDLIRPNASVRDNHNISFPAGRRIGGIVRLAFHDAVEYDPSDTGVPRRRADGCINMNEPRNAGLQSSIDYLDTLWMPFCAKISRADFWYLAAKVAMEMSCPYFDAGGRQSNVTAIGRRLKAGFIVENWHIPFYIGRVDTPTCTYSQLTRVPDAEKRATEIRRALITNFGLDVRGAVALMGAHTLGGLSPNNSGYDGLWKTRPDLVTTEYFKNLREAKFDREQHSDPRTAATIHQWRINTGGPEKLGNVNINPDMELMYSIDPETPSSLPTSCGPYNDTHNTCPPIESAYPDLQFSQWVLAFAQGNTSTVDSPGSVWWLSVFARSFNQMSQVGYAQGDLTCLQCQSPNCFGACTQLDMCEGPQYGYWGTRYCGFGNCGPLHTTTTATPTPVPGQPTRTRTATHPATRTRTAAHPAPTGTRVRRTKTRTRTAVPAPTESRTPTAETPTPTGNAAQLSTPTAADLGAASAVTPMNLVVLVALLLAALL